MFCPRAESRKYTFLSADSLSEEDEEEGPGAGLINNQV